MQSLFHKQNSLDTFIFSKQAGKYLKEICPDSEKKYHICDGESTVDLHTHGGSLMYGNLLPTFGHDKFTLYLPTDELK